MNEKPQKCMCMPNVSAIFFQSERTYCSLTQQLETVIILNIYCVSIKVESYSTATTLVLTQLIQIHRLAVWPSSAQLINTKWAYKEFGWLDHLASTWLQLPPSSTGPDT